MRFLHLALAAALPVAAGLLVSGVQDNGRRISFQFEIVDTADILPDRAGQPFFPLHFCLPPGATVKAASVQTSDFPARMERGEAGFVRSAFVAAFRFYPISIQNGARQLARRGTAVVDYSASSATLSGGAPFYDSGPAEASLGRLIRNYSSSARYRFPSRGVLQKAFSQPYQNAKVKFFVKKDGVFSITFEDLSALGFPLSTVDPITFRLFTSQGEVPIHVESSRKGAFSPGDRILFYGEFLRGTGAHYLPEHTLGRAYYLGWGAAPGLRAVLVSALPKVRDPDGTLRFIDPFAFTEDGGGQIKPVTVFRRKVHLEEDNLILRLSSPNGLVSTDVSPENLTASVGDYWQWMQMCKDVNTGEFFLDGDHALSGKARIRVAFQGVSKGTHTIDNLAVNSTKLVRDSASGAGNLSWVGQTQAVFVSELSDRVQKALHGGRDTLNVTLGSAGDCIFLNWIEVEYDAVPGLQNQGIQRITLDSGAVPARGSYSFSLPNVPSIPELWDVSGRRFIDLTIANGVLKFYDLLEGPATYFASINVLKPDGLSVKSNSDFKLAGLGADLLIVVPRALLGSVSAYAEYKRREGLQVVVADAETIYDQFGDGSIDPEAIKAFVKYAYENYSPKPFYLLLIGDTSEGSDKLAPKRNLIPTFFIQVGGWGICSADSRFTLVSGDDLFPDLSVGRIPGQSAGQIEAALRKLMDYGTRSRRGPWKSDFLLIGGFEPIFTLANDRFQNFTLKDKFNVTRVDVDTLSPYFLGNNSPAEAQRLFDQGSLFASFYGHGGGSVWSDFSPSLMDISDAERLSNGATLPIIYSLTCLTASFEAITFGAPRDLWPPLGETMILSPGGGAAFYGASGHSSSQADYYLGLLLTQFSPDTALTRAGDIIFKAEQSLISTYGTDYFPVIGQYNLLGDPSLKIERPAVLGVALRDSMLSAGDTLVAYLSSPAVHSGEGLAQIFQQGNLLFSTPFTLKAKKDTLRIPFKPGLRQMTDGLVRISVWNASADEMGQVPFGVSEVTLSSVRALSAAQGNLYTGRPAIGDTVALEAELLVPTGFIIDSVMAEWVADTGYAYNTLLPGIQILPLARIDTLSAGESQKYRSPAGIPIDLATFEAVRGLTYDIRVDFRDAGGTPSLKRQFFHLPIAASPDLSFTTANQTRLILSGGPVAVTPFLNYGESDARPFEISQAVNGGAPFTFVLTHPLAPRVPEAAQIPLLQTGFINVKITLDSRGEVVESNEGNNTAESFFGVAAARFGLGDSILAAPGESLFIYPTHPNDTFEALAVIDQIDSLSAGGLPVFQKQNPYPLAHLQEFYAPRGSAALSRRDLTVQGVAGASTDSTRLTVKYFLTPDYFDTLHPQTAGFYIWDTLIHFWRWAGGKTDTTDSSVSFKTGLHRRFAPGRKKDFEAPEIIASVDGRVLSYKDYIPLKTPIDVVIRDEGPVDIQSVKLWTSGKELVSPAAYSIGYVNGSGNVHISFRPFKRGPDSLIIAAADVNGNGPDTARFGYLLGDNLKIEKFANHPNPFGAKTTFAFTITDNADAVLDVYSVSGHRVRRFERKNIIGYQEIVWDARNEDGRKLSNGVYYLKLTVKNRTATLEQIHKLAKAEGR